MTRRFVTLLGPRTVRHGMQMSISRDEAPWHIDSFLRLFDFAHRNNALIIPHMTYHPKTKGMTGPL